MKTSEVIKLLITFVFFLPYMLLFRRLVTSLEEQHAKGSLFRRTLTYIPLLIIGWPIEKGYNLMMDMNLFS